jgi:hypothetical protein
LPYPPARRRGIARPVVGDPPSRERVFDGAAEARLLAIACSEPPDGRPAWTLRC